MRLHDDNLRTCFRCSSAPHPVVLIMPSPEKKLIVRCGVFFSAELKIILRFSGDSGSCAAPLHVDENFKEYLMDFRGITSLESAKLPIKIARMEILAFRSDDNFGTEVPREGFFVGGHS